MLRMIIQPLSGILLKCFPAENFPSPFLVMLFSVALSSFMLFCSLVGDGAATLVKTHTKINKPSRHLIQKNAGCLWTAAIRVTALKTAGKRVTKLAKMAGRCPGGNISRRTQKLFENTLKSKVRNIWIAIFETYE